LHLNIAFNQYASMSTVIGSSLLCSAVVSYDVTHFRVKAAIGTKY